MRYKEYNVNSVLEKCIRLFWSCGFRACSVQDIVKATGVNRFSLYHEFENKEGILYRTLQLYRERYCLNKFSILEEEGELDEILARFYLSFLEEKKEIQGCFFIHVGTELADTDPNIRLLVKEYLQEIEMLFQKVLSRFDWTREYADQYARHLIGLYCTSNSFCLIHSEEERKKHISNGIRVIIDKNKAHATSIK